MGQPDLADMQAYLPAWHLPGLMRMVTWVQV